MLADESLSMTSLDDQNPQSARSSAIPAKAPQRLRKPKKKMTCREMPARGDIQRGKLEGP
jgi:hypothetical protein